MASREVREDQHGTRAGYRTLGCRCELCRAWNREAQRAWRAANSEKYRQLREDQHGTLTSYSYGCRCEVCREANRARGRRYRDENRALINERARSYYDPAAGRERWRRYREANRDYLNERAGAWYRLRQAESLTAAAVPLFTRWQPHEDALLGRVESNTAAASALGRTFASVAGRRERLRKLGVLA